MKITLDVSAAAQQGAGIGRSTRTLTRGLLADGANAYTLFYNTPNQAHLPEDISAPQITVPWGNKPLRLRWLLSHALRRPLDHRVGSPELYHGLDHIAPFLRAPSIVTIHDCSFLTHRQYHTRLNSLNLRLAVPLSVRQASLVIAVSQNTRRDLLNWLHLPPDKVRVIAWGVDHNRFNTQGNAQAELAHLRQRFNLAPPFILFVSTLEPRKNVTGLLDAFAQVRQAAVATQLVLAGKQGWGYPPMQQLIDERGLADSVILAGYVNDTDLRALYHHATLCAYPSFYEGFGLPALEAMACGTPVVTSNTSSLPEVVGDAALTVNPHDRRALAEAMQRVITDSELRQTLAARGIGRAAQFTWQKTVQETIALYSEIFHRPPQEAHVPHRH